MVLILIGLIESVGVIDLVFNKNIFSWYLMILPHPFYSNWDGNPDLSLRPTFLSPLGPPSFLFVSSILFSDQKAARENSVGSVDFRNASSSGHFVETCRQLHRRVRVVEGSDDFPLRC